METTTKRQSTYSHAALKTGGSAIRLVVLQPAAPESSLIQCSLCSASLDQKCEYQALSHMSDDPTDKRRILVNGKEFWVTKSLEQALWYLRPKERNNPCVLWVDEICINWQDSAEQAAQSELMAKIYSQARQVVIWLGRDTSHMRDAFRILKRTEQEGKDNRKPQSTPQNIQNSPVSSSGPPQTSKRLPRVPISALTLPNCINTFFTAPWWRKAWTCQGIILAQDIRIQCGPLVIDWDWIVRIVPILCEHEAIDEEGNGIFLGSKGTATPRYSTLNRLVVRSLSRVYAALCFRRQVHSRSRLTPLHVCIATGQIARAAALLDEGVDIEAKDELGRTPLHLSIIAENQPEVVEFLLQRGANANAESYSSKSPLSLACEQGAFRIVDLLISAKAELQHRGRHGETLLHSTVMSGNLDAFELFLRQVRTKSPERFEDFINATDFAGRSALHYSVMYSNDGAFEILADLGVTMFQTDFGRQSLLHLAAMNGNSTVLPVLLDRLSRETTQVNADPHGTDLAVDFGVNAINGIGETPLLLAAMMGQDKCVRVLLEAGADVDSRDYAGVTPLCEAVARNFDSIDTMLRNAGADPSILREFEIRPAEGDVDTAIIGKPRDKDTYWLEPQDRPTRVSKTSRFEDEDEYKYKYKSLTDSTSRIRLLRLDPAETRSAPLRATLQEVSVHKEPGDNPAAWEAVSYVWGDPIFDVELQIGDKTIFITEHLSEALRTFRLSTEIRNLWVDAVCINQGDDKEKQYQIPLMTRVYTQAETVLIWLGELSSEHQETIQLLEGIYKNDSIQKRLHEHDKWIPDTTLQGMLLTDYLDPPTKEVIDTEWQPKAIRRGKTLSFSGLTGSAIIIMSSPKWFERIWIIQEAALATELHVYLGSINMEWTRYIYLSMLAAQILWLSDDRLILTSEGQGIPFWLEAMATTHELRALPKALGKQPSLRLTTWFSLLTKLSSRQCTKDHDRIYGLLGILPEDLASTVIPDYTLEVEQIYTFIARLILEREGLTSLYLAGSWRGQWKMLIGGNGNILSTSVPSWAIDLRPRIRTDSLPMFTQLEAAVIDPDEEPTGISLPTSSRVQIDELFGPRDVFDNGPIPTGTEPFGRSYRIGLRGTWLGSVVSVFRVSDAHERGRANLGFIEGVQREGLAFDQKFDAPGVIAAFFTIGRRVTKILNHVYGANNCNDLSADKKESMAYTLLGGAGTELFQKATSDGLESSPSTALDCYLSCILAHKGELYCLMRDFRQILFRGGSVDNLEGQIDKLTNPEDITAYKFHCAAKRTFSQHSFVPISTGLVGLMPTTDTFLRSTPEHEWIFDIVAIQGTRVPLAMRRLKEKWDARPVMETRRQSPSEGDHHALIGPCYVHGMMDLEWKEWQASKSCNITLI